MKISAIAAVAANQCIGHQGSLPWDIPEDMRFFRKKTLGHILIMGRKTLQSMPGALKKRHNIVISHTQCPNTPNTEFVTSKKEALDAVQKIADNWPEEVFIIGGAQIYELFLPEIKTLYLTEIHSNFDGDTFFPDFSHCGFKEVARIEHTNSPPFDFVTYKRP